MHALFLLDTPNIWHGQALAGTPARVLALAEHCRTPGSRTTLVLADRGADYGYPGDWRCDTLLVHPTDFYRPAALAELLAPLAPDVVVGCEAQALLRTVGPAARRLDACLVYDVHDDDSVIATGLGESASAVARRRAAQRRALRAADIIVVSTRHEARLARAAGVAATRMLLAPNGADPITRTCHGPDAGARLLVFVGNLYYEPNGQAVTAIRNILVPGLRARRQPVRVRVIGRGPRDVQRPAPGLEFTGRVPDLGAALAGATLALAPLTIGSGAKMKVLDYLAAGLPVLGTSEAFTGLPPDHPGVVVEDHLDAYPRVVTDLLADPARLRRLGRAGRGCVEDSLSWRRIGVDLAAGLSQLLDGSYGPGPALPAVAGRQPPQWLAEHTAKGALRQPSLAAPDAPRWLRRQPVRSTR